MRKLIAVGFFRELSDQPEAANQPSVFDFVRAAAEPNAKKIIHYLKSGVAIAGRGCIVHDVVNPTNGVGLTCGTLTDGVYIWQENLAHFVEKYHVALPVEFLQRMNSLNWICPSFDVTRIKD